MKITPQFSAIAQPATVKHPVQFAGIKEKNVAALAAEKESQHFDLLVGQAMLDNVRDLLDKPLTSTGVTGREILEELIKFYERNSLNPRLLLLDEFPNQDHKNVLKFLRKLKLDHGMFSVRNYSYDDYKYLALSIREALQQESNRPQ